MNKISQGLNANLILKYSCCMSLFSHLSKSLPCFFKEFLSSWGKAVFRSHYSFYIKMNIHVVLFCPCERHERKTIPALFSCKCIFLTSPWTDCSSQLKTLTSSGNYSSIYSLRWERSQESMCWKQKQHRIQSRLLQALSKWVLETPRTRTYSLWESCSSA